MNIRQATPDDIPRIIEMGAIFWAQTAYRDIPYCPDSIAESALEMMASRLLIVAELEGRVVGAVGALAVPLYANRDVLTASELYWYVDEDHRNSGAGKLLLAGIEDAARARGVKLFGMMALDAVEPDKAAAMYKRLGYQPGERTFYKVL